jgi:ABC-type transport system involved in multi-copper enzyme maturation permease subunit
MQALTQILAIARTEFRFALRRGAVVIVTAVTGLVIGAALLLDPLNDVRSDDTSLDRFTPEQVESMRQMGITPAVWRSLLRDTSADIAAGSAVYSWSYVYLGLILLPLAAAGAVPADRQFGTWELLRSAPLTAPTYLVGKILGLWAAAAFVMLFPLLLGLAALEAAMLIRYQVGIPVELLRLYLGLALLDGLPILFFAAAAGALAGVAFRSRRAAVLPGLVVGLTAFLSWPAAFAAPFAELHHLDRAAYWAFQRYRSVAEAAWRQIKPDIPAVDLSLLGAHAPRLGPSHLLGMYLVVVFVLAAGGALARLWLDRKDDF